MISDLLDVTDANILLIIGDDQLSSISDLLHSNNYYKTQKATDAKTASDLIKEGKKNGVKK
ncbi:MAG TPA: hypothetical protein C5S51_00220, partial [Methanosarcinaceae archaeon]|nr:hypothetical protein [Methanosarcinaceae archaeon]